MWMRSSIGCLVDDSALAAAMVSPVTRSDRVPHEPTIRSLERIVLRYPRSSYADYARFALARTYLKGNDKATEASEEQKTAAIALLESINAREFAYGADVLLLLESIIGDTKKGDKLRAALRADYADAIEWISAEVETFSEELLREMKGKAPILRGPRNSKEE